MTRFNKKYLSLINKVLDGEASEKQRRELFDHLALCGDCREHYNELKHSTEILIHLPHPQLPATFTNTVLEKLPVEKRHALKTWMTRHPLLSAAAICALPMSFAMIAAKRQGFIQEKNGGGQYILLKMPGDRS